MSSVDQIYKENQKMPKIEKLKNDHESTPCSVNLDSLGICEYVAEMSLELRNMCKSADQPYLAYLLEIVFTEATDIATKARIKEMNSHQQ